MLAAAGVPLLAHAELLEDVPPTQVGLGLRAVRNIAVMSCFGLTWHFGTLMVSGSYSSVGRTFGPVASAVMCSSHTITATQAHVTRAHTGGQELCIATECMMRQQTAHTMWTTK